MSIVSKTVSVVSTIQKVGVSISLWLSITLSVVSIYIQDHVHSIQDHVRSIHHTEGRGQHRPLAQHHAFRSIHIHIQDHVHSIQDHVRSIHHTEGRGQHRPLA